MDLDVQALARLHVQHNTSTCFNRNTGKGGGGRERERVLVELLDAARPLVIEAITTRRNKCAPPPSGTTNTLD